MLRSYGCWYNLTLQYKKMTAQDLSKKLVFVSLCWLALSNPSWSPLGFCLMLIVTYLPHMGFFFLSNFVLSYYKQRLEIIL